MLAPGGPTLRIGMLSTYPPTTCGLASIASGLERALVAAGHHVSVVAVDDGSRESRTGRSLVGVLPHGHPGSVDRVARVLSQNDVVVVQHDFGIFGGADGEEVLDVLAALDVPCMVVLHSVPREPTEHQFSVMRQVCARASLVVAPTTVARDRILSTYDVDPATVVTIALGSLVVPTGLPTHLDHFGAHGHLLTWGLLRPGKGVEHVIDAVALLNDVGYPVRYTVAGPTDPRVAARNGEAYRAALVRRARARGVASLVRFDQAYRGPASLVRLISASSVVVAAYDTMDQVVSGVLVDSLAAGRAVIATDFPHAREELDGGAGILVPHGDVDALARAIRAVTGSPAVLDRLTVQAREAARRHDWSIVAERYVEEACGLVEMVSRIPA